MDLLLEFIFEFILETAFESTKSSKIPKWIRFLIGSLLFGFYLVLIGLILYIAIVNQEENRNLSIFLILIAVLLLLFLVLDARKVYCSMKKNTREK